MKPGTLVSYAISVTIAATAATVEATPTNQFTKAQSGAIDNCDTPVIYTGQGGAESAPEATLLGRGNVNQGP